MQDKNTQYLYITGFLLIMIFNLLAALQDVYAASLLQGIPPELLIFVCFSICALYFNLTYFRNPKAYLEDIKSNASDIFALNVSTVGAWFGFYYSIKYIEPAVATSITIAVGPILTITLEPILRQKVNILKSELFSAMGILISVLLLFIFTWKGQTAIGQISTTHSIIGIIAAVIGGVGIVGITLYGKKLHDKGWSAKKVIAVRFFMLILVSCFLTFHLVENYDIILTYIEDFLMIAILGGIVPLYCLQLGIERVEPITVTLCLSIIPLFTFVIQLFDKRLSYSPHSLTTIFLLLFFMSFGVIGRYRSAS